ncbi:MAG: segregation and condensation protein A [Gammaproteobacteria bacterium]|jgi:hypothetical protein|nr:segregation and condensation protein A [Gammaproteobacteria bacterium]
MSAESESKEERVLKAVYRVLIDVIKDTTTDPRLKHPLSDRTKEAIRDCLDLITARQAEIAAAAGRTVGQERPHYADEPRDTVVVPVDLDALRRSRKKPSPE